MRKALPFVLLALPAFAAADAVVVPHLLDVRGQQSAVFNVSGGVPRVVRERKGVSDSKYVEWGPGKVVYDDLHCTFLKGNRTMSAFVTESLRASCPQLSFILTSPSLTTKDLATRQAFDG